MAAERKQFATAKRAEGAEISEGIRALADQRVTIIKAKASAQGAAIRAKGNHLAGLVYAESYGKD
jgi:membrane protease subunit HflC